MIKGWGLAAVIWVMAAAPVWAQSNTCGDEPIAPAVPTAAEIGEKNPADAAKLKHQTFAEIKAWQTSLGDYRKCLDAAKSTTTRQLQDATSQSKPDADKIKKLQAEIDATKKAYDRSIDSEEQIANDWNALSTAYCSRPDVDKATCPKA